MGSRPLCTLQFEDPCSRLFYIPLIAMNLLKLRSHHFVLAVIATVSLGCESLNFGGGKKDGEVPEDGLLGAKITAMEYAMNNLSAENRRFVDGDYDFYGIRDRDPLEEKALLAVFKGRQPPVVPAAELYSRSSNSQWKDGKPALKWTATAVKSPSNPQHAEVLVGWMHSQIINEFTTYVLEFDGTGWSVIDVQMVDSDL
jgi:hypothetical protein